MRLLGALAGPVLSDIGFELRGLLFLAIGLPFEHLGPLLAELPVLRVIAGIGGDRPFVQLPDFRDDLVQEIAIVADDDHPHRLPGEVILQPFGGLDVEVIRGLVQEHQIGALEEELGQHQAGLLPPREGLRGAIEFAFLEAEPSEDLLHAMVDRVGVLMLDLLDQFVVAASRPFALGVVLGLGEFLGRLLDLALELDERGQARLRHVSQRLIGGEVGLLTQQADSDARPDIQAAVIGLVERSEQLHQGRLAGPVRPDQADSFPGAHLERQVGEDRIAGKLPSQVSGGNQDHGLIGVRASVGGDVFVKRPLLAQHVMVMLGETVGLIPSILEEP